MVSTHGFPRKIIHILQEGHQMMSCFPIMTSNGVMFQSSSSGGAIMMVLCFQWGIYVSMYGYFNRTNDF